jgi:hypothetical protein
MHHLLVTKELHHMIASHANHNLVRRQYKPVFTFGEGVKNRFEIDLCIDSHDPEMGDYTLTMEDYIFTICACYHEHKDIIFNAYCSKSPYHDHISKPSFFIKNPSGWKQENGYRVPNQVAMNANELISKSSDLLEEERIYQASLNKTKKVVSHSAIGPFAQMFIKVFSQGEQVIVFPLLMRHFIDKKNGRFKKLRSISSYIAKVIDCELVTRGEKAHFSSSPKWEYGQMMDMHVASYDYSISSEELLITDHNYEDALLRSYYTDKQLIMLHIHTDCILFNRTLSKDKEKKIALKVPQNAELDFATGKPGCESSDTIYEGLGSKEYEQTTNTLTSPHDAVPNYHHGFSCNGAEDLQDDQLGTSVPLAEESTPIKENDEELKKRNAALMLTVEDIHSSGTYQCVDNHIPNIIDHSNPGKDKKIKDCKTYDARRTMIANLFNHVLISNKCHPAFVHSSGNHSTDCGYQLDLCSNVGKVDVNTLKLDTLGDIILYPLQSRFMVQNGHVISALLRYLQANIDDSYYSMTGNTRKDRCFDWWGRMKKKCCSPSNVNKILNSCHWFYIKGYDHEQNDALISLMLSYFVQNERHLKNLLLFSMDHTMYCEYLNMLIMEPRVWLQENDFVTPHPIHMELLIRDNPYIPVLLEVLFSQQEDLFTSMVYGYFSGSRMRDKYISITSSSCIGYEETNVYVNEGMIFYDPRIPAVVNNCVFHYSWFVPNHSLLSFLNWGRMNVGFLPSSAVTLENGVGLLSCYINKAKTFISMCLFNQSSCRYMWML